MPATPSTKRTPDTLDLIARLLSAEIPDPPPEAGSRGFFDARITAFELERRPTAVLSGANALTLVFLGRQRQRSRGQGADILRSE